MQLISLVLEGNGRGVDMGEIGGGRELGGEEGGEAGVGMLYMREE